MYVMSENLNNEKLQQNFKIKLLKIDILLLKNWNWKLQEQPRNNNNIFYFHTP